MIKVGMIIMWKNFDVELYIVVNDVGIFYLKVFDQDEMYLFCFDKLGVYKVFCGIYLYMKEMIIVE